MLTQIKVVMFTDEIGSTPNSERRVPAKKRRVSDERSALTAAAVGLCRGVIIADTGDGHMLTFDSCADAVLCGHLIQQRVAERNAGLSHESALQFDLHIGIDFGDVVPLPDGNIRSDAANRAARVCNLCPAGDVYFTEKVTHELHPDDVECTKVGDFDLKGVSGKVSVYRLAQWRGTVPYASNPFVWRSGITDHSTFFGREWELRRLKDFLLKRQNCQVVGAPRIGASSLLLHIERQVPTWHQNSVIAMMDMQYPACFTLTGFLRRSGAQFGWLQQPTTLVDFAESVETMCGQGLRPVLCIDEFEVFTMHPNEFQGDFFQTLSSCSRLGMSIVTASHQPLSELVVKFGLASPFFNTFALIDLGIFTLEESADFLRGFRLGFAFTSEEKERIQEFARCHPFALQVAAYYVVEARERGDRLTDAIQSARAEISTVLPSW